ncbi:hypothetical protein STEG23_036524 [Scotinomys teguina]
MNQGFFLSPDFYKHKSIDCRFINSTFLEQKEGCHMDFEEDNDFLIYLISFLGSLSVLPGNIISALLMDRIGRLKMIDSPYSAPDCGGSNGNITVTEAINILMFKEQMID